MCHPNNKKFWMEFLEKYKSHPCLWDIRYRDKEKNQAAYDDLLQTMKKMNPKADEAAVKKQINLYRDGYRKQLFKTEKLNGPGRTIKRKLCYYDLLDSFLNPRNRGFVELEDTNRHSLNDKNEQHEYAIKNFSTFSEHSNCRTSPKDTGENIKKNHSPKRKAECYFLQKRITSHFPKMNATQRLLAEKLINEICTLGQIGNLTMESFIA